MLNNRFLSTLFGHRTDAGISVLAPQVGIVLFLLAVCMVGGSPAVFLGLAIWAFRGYRQALEALTLSFLLLYLNSAVFPVSALSLSLRWLVFVAAVARIFMDASYKKTTLPMPIAALLAFSGTTFLITLLVSPMMATSLFKLFAFTLGVGAVIVSARLNAGQFNYWSSWFFTLALVVLCLSIPTYFVSSIGRVRNGQGFQGILNHPQALGIFICPIVAWLTGVFITRQKRSVAIKIALVLGWLSIFLSLARTSLIAILLGLIFSVAVMAIFRNGLFRATLKSIFHSKKAIANALAGGIVALGIVFLSWSSIQEGLSDFISKGNDESTSIAEGIQKSRGELVEKSMDNFRDNPLTGIGFGVPSDTSSVPSEDASGILASAPVEKGFVVSASLEETGIVGTVLLFILIISMTSLVLSNDSFPLLWLFFTCLMVNVGEMILFAVGGIGFYMWLLMGMALIEQKKQETQTAKRSSLRLRDKHSYR